MIQVCTLEGLGSAVCDEMFQLRCRVFDERLQWSVSNRNGREYDDFDDVDAMYVVMQDGRSAGVTGCLRLRPTLRPYMLADVFPELLGGEPVPREAHVWEISRFAYEQRVDSGVGWGFSASALHLIRAAVIMAHAVGIERYVIVTTPPIERMMRFQRMDVQRLAEPRVVGSVRSVALSLSINARTRAAMQWAGRASSAMRSGFGCRSKHQEGQPWHRES